MENVDVEHHSRPGSLTIEALNRVEGVIFDVDGTLYDQAALRRRIVPRIAAAHWTRPVTGVRVVRALQAYRRAHEELRNQVFSADLQLATAAASCGYPVAEVRAAVDQWFERMPLEYLPRCGYAGLPAFLQLLSGLRVSCGVFSDYPAEGKLAAMGLKRFFSHVLSAADVGRQKPDPLGLLTVARAMGIAPECALYLGDRSIDMEAAAKAGMQGILVRSRNTYTILHDRFSGRGPHRRP